MVTWDVSRESGPRGWVIICPRSCSRRCWRGQRKMSEDGRVIARCSTGLMASRFTASRAFKYLPRNTEAHPFSRLKTSGLISPSCLPRRAHSISHVERPSREMRNRSEEHTSELQSHSFISYAVFCLKKNKKKSAQKHRTGAHLTSHGAPPSLSD